MEPTSKSAVAWSWSNTYLKVEPVLVQCPVAANCTPAKAERSKLEHVKFVKMSGEVVTMSIGDCRPVLASQLDGPHLQQ